MVEGEGWLAFAVDGHGRLVANSIPLEDGDLAISHTVKALEMRGIEGFEVVAAGAPQQEHTARAILSGCGLDLALDGIPPMQLSILRRVRQVPRGYVASYGDVAYSLGKPGLARAVGIALARNPFPILVPCHRVVRSDLTLGGFSYGERAKRLLLEKEGVEVFEERGKIRIRARHRLARDRLSCRS